MQKASPPPRPHTAGAVGRSPSGNSLFRGNPRGVLGSPVPLTAGQSPLPLSVTGVDSTPPPSSLQLAASSPAIDRLEGVKASLATLGNVIQGTALSDSRRYSALGEGRMIEMKDAAIRLEQHLALEVKRRAEGDAKLQTLVDARAREITATLEKKVTERLLAMHHQVDTLTKRVGQLNADLALEREKNVRLTQELRYHAAQGLGDIKQAVEQERVQRQEKEGLLSKKLSEDVFRLQERIDVERHAREMMLTAVKEEMGQVKKYREKGDERFIRKLNEDIAALKKQLTAEEETRKRGEEHLAKAMEEIVEQLHNGLRVLSGQT